MGDLNGIEVTDVAIRPVYGSGPVRAYADVTLNGIVTIAGLKILDLRGGTIVAFPELPEVVKCPDCPGGDHSGRTPSGARYCMWCGRLLPSSGRRSRDIIRPADAGRTFRFAIRDIVLEKWMTMLELEASA
jgi:hypothetical protein